MFYLGSQEAMIKLILWPTKHRKCKIVSQNWIRILLVNFRFVQCYIQFCECWTLLLVSNVNDRVWSQGRESLLWSVKSFKLKLSSPRGAWAFHELRRYHIRPIRFNWGLKSVHFGKMHFRDLNMALGFFTTVPKNGPKKDLKWPQSYSHFLDISYKDKCSGNQYIECWEYSSCCCCCCSPDSWATCHL